MKNDEQDNNRQQIKFILAQSKSYIQQKIDKAFDFISEKMKPSLKNNGSIGLETYDTEEYKNHWQKYNTNDLLKQKLIDNNNLLFDFNDETILPEIINLLKSFAIRWKVSSVSTNLKQVNFCLQIAPIYEDSENQIELDCYDSFNPIKYQVEIDYSKDLGTNLSKKN